MLIRKTRSLLRPSGELNSLFGEILDWLLAPLLFLWPITIVVTYHVANGIADVPYDKSLADNVKAIARQVQVGEGGIRFNFPASARALLRADEEDSIYYQVLGGKGEVISGDLEIPVPLQQSVETLATKAEGHEVRFRDAEIAGEDVRIAWQTLPAGRSYLVVQVAETRAKRTALARRIVSGVLLAQFIIIPLAVVLVYLGLGRGIAPLKRLRRLIEQRRPTDLSPIAVDRVPEEMRPLILAFNDMMARLEETLQAQQRFIADAAHQMRTPLTGLMMQAELALDETDPVQMRAFLERISSGAQRAAHLINQLLSLARAESSFEQVHGVEDVNLAQIGQEVALDLAPAAMACAIDIGFDGDSVCTGVQGNALLLKEMTKNLLDNAIKYTPAGGKVTVRVQGGGMVESAPGNWLLHGPVLEVEDTGIGIPEADREQVFDRFFRVLGNGAEGSGLGLAIVREIAEKHRAQVELLPSPLGQGTLARVSFPASSPLPPPGSPKVAGSDE